MTARVLLALGVLLAAWAAGLAWIELRSARAAAYYATDSARLQALLEGCTALHTSALEARAGLEQSFDDIDRAIIALRAASSTAGVVRGRGADYALAADELARAAEALRVDEPAVETFKTDLALLRVSSRYFPLAADALTQRADARRVASKVPWSTALAALRTDVARYEEAPTRAAAQRIETDITALAGHGATLEETSAESADLSALLGHTRVIVDRRERVDRFARGLARSGVRMHVEAARAAYERALHKQVGRVVALRIVASELAAAGLVALGTLAWLRARARGTLQL